MNQSGIQNTNREKILEVSWQLFQQKGYRGVSVDEICMQSGITKPTLYYYFHNKEELFARVLENRLINFHQAGAAPGSLAERLQRVALSILDSFESDYSFLLRDREHLTRPENLARVRNAFRSELYQPIYDLMREGIAAGELADQDAELLTLAFLGIVNNFIGKSTEKGFQNQELAEGMVMLFLRGASVARISPQSLN
jgi:TetR/AcrR family transcriptional repressor of mexJK operon